MYKYLGNKLFYSVALATLLVLSGCSSSEGESNSSTGGTGQQTFSANGKGVDGYIANADIYADLDKSGDQNSSEPTTTTGAQGNFSFDPVQLEKGVFLYLSGGTDIALNKDFTGTLSAYFNGVNTIVSPLSTMVVSLMKNEGLSYEEALARVAAMMHITVDEVTADPYSVPKAFVASQRIVLAATMLDGNFSKAIKALASSDMDIRVAGTSMVPSAATSHVDAASAVDEYITVIATHIPVGATADDFATYQRKLISVAANPSNIPNLLAVENAIQCITFDAIKSKNSSETNITSPLDISGCESSDDNVTFVWESNNTALIVTDGTIGSPVYIGGNVNMSVRITSDANTSVSDSTSFDLSVPRLDNHPPVTTLDVNTTAEDSAISFNLLANDTDEDGDALTLIAASNGVAFLADGTVTYMPELNFNGTFVFDYTVKDSWGDEVNATATVNVTAVNDAPTMDVITEKIVPEDFITSAVYIDGSDVDNDDLSYTLISIVPQLVNASFDGNKFKLTSIADLNGDSNITVMVSDGDKNDTKTFTVHVTAVDDAPVLAVYSNITVAEDNGTISIAPSASDVDNDDSLITYSYVSSDPKIIRVTGTTIETVPDANGMATVTITATSNGLTASSDFNLSVTPVDDAPVLSHVLDVTFDEDGNKIIILSATDIENDPISFNVNDIDNSLLSAIVSGNKITFTGRPNAFGTVDLNVTAVSNGLMDSQRVLVTVNPINDLPIIENDFNFKSLDEDFTTSITSALHVSDVDGDNITYSVTSTGADINLNLSGSTLNIASIKDANGDANITVHVFDGNVTVSKSFNLHINPIDDAPVLSRYQNVAVLEDDGTIIVTPSASDVDNDDSLITYSYVSLDPKIIRVTGTTIETVPDANGMAMVTITATSNGLTASSDFNITVTAVDDAPVLSTYKNVTVLEDNGTIEITPSANDVDNDNGLITYSYTSSDPSRVRVVGMTVETMPDAYGMATVTITATSNGLTASSDFNITVTAVNDAPIANNISIEVTKGNQKTFSLAHKISDVDGDSLTVTHTDTVGTLSYDDATKIFTYDDNGTNGTYTFGYTVSDGTLSDTKTITLTVSTTPITPIAHDLSVTTLEETPIDIELLKANLNATSIVSATLSVNNNGSVVINNNGTITFTPGLDFDGDTIIKYTVASETSTKASASITVHVTDVNDAPVIQPIADILLLEDNKTSIYVDVNITDVESVGTLTTFSSSNPAQVDVGSIVGLGNGLYRVPLSIMPNFNGDTTITLGASDGNLTTASSFVISITPVADAPVITSPDDRTIAFDTTESVVIEILTAYNENYTLEATADGSLLSASVSGQNVELTSASSPGSTTITLHAYNNADKSLESTVTWTVTVSDLNNNAPIASASEFSVVADDIAEVKLVVHDPDDNALTFTYSTPAHGRIVSTDSLGNMIYTSTDGFIGEDSFTYIASDGTLDSGTAVTVSVHVIAATNETDSNDDTSIPFADYTKATALSANGIPMYYLSKSDLSYSHSLIDTSAKTISTYEDTETTPFVDNFTVNNPDNNEILQDYDDDGIVDFKAKYIGTVSKEEIERDNNITLPVGSRGYELLSLFVAEEYDFSFDPEYQDWNTTTGIGSNPYRTLDDFVTDTSFDTNNPKMHNIQIDGYRFMFAQGTNFSDGSGEIVRYAQYNDGSGEQYIITNPNAGTWEVVNVDDTDVIKVKPSLYNITTIRIYQASDVVYNGKYYGPNHATLEHYYDKKTMFHIGNSIMNVDVNITQPDLPDARGEFESFNTLPTEPFVQDVWMYTVTEDSLRSYKFQSDGTMLVTDTESGDANGSYTITNNIASIATSFDFKITKELKTASELALVTHLPESIFGTSHQAYFMAQIVADDGSETLYFDKKTFDAIDDYVQQQRADGNNIEPTVPYIKFTRDVKAVAFTDNRMYSVEYNGENNISTKYIQFNGAIGHVSNEPFVVSDNSGSYTYRSSDGLITTINDGTNDVMMFKVKEDLNATQLMTETHLFLPETARGYRTVYMNLNSSNSDAINIRFDEATSGYLESYLYNNPRAKQSESTATALNPAE